MQASSPRVAKRSSTLDIVAVIHTSADDFLDATREHLELRQREANVIYPHARKTYERERATRRKPSLGARSFWERRMAIGEGDPHQSMANVACGTQFWISVWTFRSPLSPTKPVLDFALACTSSAIDALPIFIYSNYPTDALPDLGPRLSKLVEALFSNAPTSRVFSVFSPTIVSDAFALRWSARTGFAIDETPYYDASLTFVTEDTLTDEVAMKERFAKSKRTQLPNEPRLATMADLPAIARQCYIFAKEGITFPMTDKQSVLEARLYIQAKQVYVCEVQLPDGTFEIASIVAVTRNTDHHATITKVQTDAQHKGHGYAEILVRWVCAKLLFEDAMDSVALYVAHDNIPAATVYDRVGFAGLRGKERISGVENWREHGFIGAKKGFW